MTRIQACPQGVTGLRLSTRVRAISPSPTLAIDSLTKQMQREGKDVINLSVGEPDFDTPEHIKQAAAQAMAQGFTKYTPVAGIPELRAAIAAKLKEDNGLEYRPEQIVVSNGGKHSLFNAFLSLCEPGDEVIIQAPYWVSYPEIVKLAGGVPVVIETTARDGYKLTPAMIEARLSPRTRLFILNSPSNPTGAVYSRAELEAIAEVAIARDLVIVADEIYEKLVYGGAKHVSIASLSPAMRQRTVLVNGFSKAYAMTGWRMGYAAAEPDLAKAMSDLQGHSTSNPSSITQKAALAALTGPQEPVTRMAEAFASRRDLVLEELRDLPGFELAVPPQGAFYVFPDVSSVLGKAIAGQTVDSAERLCQIILAETGVSLVPGGGFGSPDCVRISYATSPKLLREAFARLKRVMSQA
ncbi:MAG: pyridoxal phosphate-dependent aminotransferase [Symbiobacteriia bacterium]